MSYNIALEKAGATLLLYKEFGTYQGDWWAKVQFNGKIGWTHGAFGSCTVCDKYMSLCGEIEDAPPPVRDNKLADLGRSYLWNMIGQEEAERCASDNIDWDMEADEMLQFIKTNSI